MCGSVSPNFAESVITDAEVVRDFMAQDMIDSLAQLLGAVAIEHDRLAVQADFVGRNHVIAGAAFG